MTAFNLSRARKALQAFDFQTLFIEELGWDYPPDVPLKVMVDGETFTLKAVAEKRNVAALRLESADAIPAYAVRRKIERQVAETYREHVIIYTDAGRTAQVWQWVRREPGKPLACREHAYTPAQAGDALLQKLQTLAFSLAEEEDLTLVDVTGRLRAAFNVERATKQFYDRFKKERDAFAQFLAGVPDEALESWYVSVMLNRLMFIYFIQKKGFLAGDPDYLRHKLVESQARGADCFYREFLCPLFFQGFALPPAQRPAEVRALLGAVPYLNGGIFQPHEVEQRYGKAIQLPDAAFQRVFDFFDGYQWHLDDRPLRDDREINPDVLGYIFEKYINQKQMGAYYTQEDITGYIARNTILPCLFGRVAAHLAGAWPLLAADPDRYIYAAVRHGCELPLPPEIAAGVDDVQRRELWNTPAPGDYALPTELWRETVARRQRYAEVRGRLAAGEVTAINDLITYNLDIEQFAQDVLEATGDPACLWAFWRALNTVSILDPTCGSGAFLFAALNLLEPLYAACLERMAAFVEEFRRQKAEGRGQKEEGRGQKEEGRGQKEEGGRKKEEGILPSSFILHPSAFILSPSRFRDFQKVLERVAAHPNATYFVLKSIVVNNLYGVDIMAEAVEIAKLRLFLKLVAQIARVQDLEPLPDIDFNIRAGNTLVGFATYAEVERAVYQEGAQMKLLLGDNPMDAIEQKAQDVDRLYQRFREQQTALGGEVTPGDKAELRKRLDALTAELDRYLAKEYGVDADAPPDFTAWRERHQPFHWFVEFYGMMHGGGFDVIVGNPPWKEYSTVKKTYTILDYATERCGNLYAMCTERALNLCSDKGRVSFIVQLPLVSSSRMVEIRKLLRDKSESLFVATFDDRPGKLFSELQHCRSVIFLSSKQETSITNLLWTTRYHRWFTHTRDHLFSTLRYTPVAQITVYPDQFPKYADVSESSVFAKVKHRGKQSIEALFSRQETDHFIFYQEAMQYWAKATVGLPYYSKNGQVGAPAHGRFLYFKSKEQTNVVSALLNSSLFYVYFVAHSDGFHLNQKLVTDFPFITELFESQEIIGLGQELMTDLRANAERKTISTHNGDKIAYDEYYGSKSKPIIDEIDRVLAQHYGFSAAELDFILNYDIKYRMGDALFEEEDADSE